MAESAIDRARARWMLPQTHQVVFDGQGSGSEFEQARELARQLMPRLIGPDGMVRATSLEELRRFLNQWGVLYFGEIPYGPPTGRMIFYNKGRLFVRVKTFGESDGKRRARVPHLSVFLVHRGDLTGQDLTAFDNELVKFSPSGLARQKSGKRGNPATDPKLTLVGINMDSWAGETHFNFPVTGCLQ